MRLVWHPYLRPGQVEFDHHEAARRDPRGHRVHLALALLWCVGATAPTTAIEILLVPLVIMFILRIPQIWRTLGSWIMQPAILALAGFAAWQAIALSWSPDPAQGQDELARLRWVVATLALWPVIMHRRALVAALCAGVVLGWISQIVHWAGLRFDIPSLTFDRMPDRNSGWWDPVAAGSMLCGILGLHLAAALGGRGAWRVVGLAGVGATLLSIFATGTRGAWIAAAALIPLGIVVAIGVSILGPRREKREGPSLIGLVPLLGVLLVAGGLLVVTQRDSIARRLERARTEIAAARTGNFASDTGARLAMWDWALRQARERPLTGVGTGGYQRWAIQRVREEQGEAAAARAPIHSHAHSAALHVLATGGAIGLGLGTMVIVLALRGGAEGWRRGESAGRFGTYAAAAPLAITGIMLAGTFDVVHLNVRSSAVLFTLLAMSLVSKPAIRPARAVLFPKARLRIL